MNRIYNNIKKQVKSGKKMFAWLIDPDKYTLEALHKRLLLAKSSGIDLVFIGGSLVIQNKIGELILEVKKQLDVPVILFPGNSMQITPEADGILFLSLISGRNADYLIGRHVESSMILKKSPLEILPTGYILIDTGTQTSVSYMSNTIPIPYDKHEIAVATAVAGELLGLKLIFLEGGSGAKIPVDPEMISMVKKNIDIPLIVGGGLVLEKQVKAALQAGADIIVAGNGIEKDPQLLSRFSEVVHSF